MKDDSLKEKVLEYLELAVRSQTWPQFTEKEIPTLELREKANQDSSSHNLLVGEFSPKKNRFLTENPELAGVGKLDQFINALATEIRRVKYEIPKSVVNPSISYVSYGIDENQFKEGIGIIKGLKLFEGDTAYKLGPEDFFDKIAKECGIKDKFSLPPKLTGLRGQLGKDYKDKDIKPTKPEQSNSTPTPSTFLTGMREAIMHRLGWKGKEVIKREIGGPAPEEKAVT